MRIPLLVAGLLLANSTALAQGLELLSNGGFEAGSLAGWTELVGAGQGHVVMQGSLPPQGFDPNTPRAGSWLFSSAVAEGATPLTPEITLRQTVTLPSIPAGALATLTAAGWVAGAAGGNGIPSNDLARIVVTLRGANGQAVATMSSPVLDPVVGTWNQLRTATLVVPATAVTADFDFATRLDPGFSSIDIGADDLSLVWDVGPACSLRNGSGINPLDLACVTPPRLGTTWQLAIATNPTTVLSAAVLGLAPQIPPLPLPQFGGGEILIGSTLASLAGSAPTLGLAAQPAAQGLVVFVQGARLDVVGGVATVVLTNALDAVLAQ